MNEKQKNEFNILLFYISKNYEINSEVINIFEKSVNFCE